MRKFDPPANPSDPRSEPTGGLFVAAVALHADFVVFRIFASRPNRATAIEQRLTLSDSAGTAYVMQAGDDEVVDGKAMLTFRPGLPREATWLKLAQPGTALVMLNPWSGQTPEPPKREST